MKRCLACMSVHVASLDACPTCGVAPHRVGGFAAFAPKLARSDGGFAQAHFLRLAHLEKRSFWFRARNRLILWALEKNAADFASLLEIGCGTIFFGLLAVDLALIGLGLNFPVGGSRLVVARKT